MECEGRLEFVLAFLMVGRRARYAEDILNRATSRCCTATGKTISTNAESRWLRLARKSSCCSMTRKNVDELIGNSRRWYGIHHVDIQKRRNR